MAKKNDNKLSIAQRDLIIAHIDGPQPAMVKEGPTRKFLMGRGILISCRRDGTPRNRMQAVHYTMITDDGRETMAQILADYAEALVRAGCLDPHAVPLTIIPFAVETVETRRFRGAFKPTLVAKERTNA